MSRTYLKILKELDYPPIYLISKEQFEMTEGAKMYGCDGIASVRFPVITVRRGLRGKALVNTLVHEVFHHLFPSRPHWWVEMASEIVACGGGRGYWSKKYNKSIEDMPSRSELLKLARRASRRMKR